MEPKTPQRKSNLRKYNRTMPRRRLDIPAHMVNYKNVEFLQKFTTEIGKIIPRRITGLAAHLHRKISRAIKQARAVNLMK